MEKVALNAVKKGDVEKLKECLNEGTNINFQDDNEQTFLHHAVLNCHCDVIEYLLQNDIDPLITDENTHTALHLAVTTLDQTPAKAILENVSLNKLRELLNFQTKPDGLTALHLAAKANSLELASLLLEYGANYELTNNADQKPINLTTAADLQELLQLIDTSFIRAKRNDRFVDDLRFSDISSITHYAPLFHCRNNEGDTLMQVLFRQEHANSHAIYLLLWRGFHSIDRKPQPKAKLEKVAWVARECLDFWHKREKDTIELLDSEVRSDWDSAIELASRMLEKVHKVVLAYRGLDGEPKSLSSCLKVRALEELFEYLGFESHWLHDCYHEVLADAWINQFGSLLMLLKMLQLFIYQFHSWMFRVLIFRAMKEDDMDKVRQLLKSEVSEKNADDICWPVLCHVVEEGNKKMVQVLLKAGAKLVYETENIWKSAFFIAVEKGYTKIVEMLLKNTGVEDLAKLSNCRKEDESTPLHVTSKNGNFELVKILLGYGANYEATDDKGRTPLEVSNSEEVSEYFKLVNDCFGDAKEANVGLLSKLKAMETEDFIAMSGARNHEGQTLVIVTAKAGAKNIAGMILKMIRKAKQNEE